MTLKVLVTDKIIARIALAWLKAIGMPVLGFKEILFKNNILYEYEWGFWAAIMDLNGRFLPIFVHRAAIVAGEGAR